MRTWAIVALVLAIIAAVLGFGGDRGVAVGIERGAFFVLLIFALVGLLLGKPKTST